MTDPVPARALDEHEAKRLLAEYGVPVVTEALAVNAAAAVAAAERIGYPVALKGCGAAFAHKTELGLVHLNLTDAAAVRAAATQVLGAMRGLGALLVQQMVRGPREFLIGMSRDAQFGPVVTFALGGIFAEALADAALRLCPLSRADAEAMLGEIRARSLLGPVRGLPAVNREALVSALLGVSRLALQRADVATIDINPLVVAGAQPVAVDALVVLR